MQNKVMTILLVTFLTGCFPTQVDRLSSEPVTKYEIKGTWVYADPFSEDILAKFKFSHNLVDVFDEENNFLVRVGYAQVISNGYELLEFDFSEVYVEICSGDNECVLERRQYSPHYLYMHILDVNDQNAKLEFANYQGTGASSPLRNLLVNVRDDEFEYFTSNQFGVYSLNASIDTKVILDHLFSGDKDGEGVLVLVR
jgi:hypothetical protein